MLVNKIYIILSIIFLLFFQNIFSQNELKEAMNAAQYNDQLKRDSLLKVVQTTKNDTLWADLYFQYFELSNSKEWIKYAPRLIKNIDSVLNIKTLSINLRKALLNRKANAKRYIYYYYNEFEGPGSKKGLVNLNDAITIYIETGNNIDLAQTYVNLANDYFRQGKLLNQLQILQDALTYFSDKKFNRGVSRFYVQLQLFYANMGDTIQALSYVDKALKLEKVIADPTRLARGYYLAGLTYSNMQKHKKAIDYLLMSEIAFSKENMQQKERITETFLLLGDEYQKIKEYDKALNVYEKAISFGTKTNDFRTVFFAMLAKGKTLSLKNEFENALTVHNELLKIITEAGELNNSRGRMVSKELAEDYYRNGNYKNAGIYMEKALRIMKREGVLVDIYEYENIAHKIDSAGKNFEGALKHYYQVNLLKEKLNKEEVLKLAAKDRFQTELELQKVTFKTEQEKKEVITKEEKQKQRVIIYAIAGLFILAGIFGVFMYRRFRLTQKQKIIIEIKNKEVEEKNKEILDSIRYARRIQTSLLPTHKYIERILNKKSRT